MEIPCCDCQNLRTDNCKMPGECVSKGYLFFKEGNKIYRCKCGAKLKVARTKWIHNRYKQTDLVCHECGLKYKNNNETYQLKT
jgi:hypothetical protein